MGHTTNISVMDRRPWTIDLSIIMLNVNVCIWVQVIAFVQLFCAFMPLCELVSYLLLLLLLFSLGLCFNSSDSTELAKLIQINQLI